MPTGSRYSSPKGIRFPGWGRFSPSRPLRLLMKKPAYLKKKSRLRLLMMLIQSHSRRRVSGRSIIRTTRKSSAVE